ncbi:hypothetical protein [Planctomyces sp. SH-PL62]|uniref:hypothetical protein n=1 Tax=Planctomyces sp. SH-PL62 TaxID=1636152 RepID=UPI00078D0823|nr:hypothetical protein [Planctomyces sp. SH-PL62]AMV37454.1 hypothetical protein VT85_08465 [Planctomyces sp. SH-PL62]
MFPLSRPARQGLATTALALLTVLPTGFTAFHAWRINRPGHVRDVEITLGRRLGLQVTLDAVAYPRPGEILFHGIVLRQEEPRGKGLAEIARAASLRLVQSGRDLIVHADELALRGESPDLAMTQVGSLLQRSGEVPYDRVELTAPSCRLDLGAGLGFSLQDVAATLASEPSGPTVRVAYRLVEPGSKTRCELTLSRDRRVDPVRTTLALKTLEGLPLPARVLDVFFDATDWIGEDARVDGRLTLRRSGGGAWEGDFAGDLHDVDLAALVGRRFPSHRLAGSARVSIENARWGDRPGQGPGWIEAKGKLTSGPGSVGVDLLTALAREMAFRPPSRHARGVDARRSEVDFGALGMAFDMRPDGEIHLAGALGNEHPPDAVLAAGVSPLIHAPEGASSVHGLIKTLVPVAAARPGTLVPLTSESRVLLCLPVAPEVARPTRTMGAN